MKKLEQIIQKYKKILTNYQQKYKIDETIFNNFTEFNNLFLKIIPKELDGISVTIDKRDEYDILNGILTQISAKHNKKTANDFENKINDLFLHRDKLVKTLLKHDYKQPKKDKPKDPLIIKPDYGYHL